MSYSHHAALPLHKYTDPKILPSVSIILRESQAFGYRMTAINAEAFWVYAVDSR